jgi:hypothetical protein
MRRRASAETEGGRVALLFNSIRVREGGRRWRTVRRRDRRAAVASIADGRRRPVMGRLGSKWATQAGQWMGRRRK